jgi:hypothetical protein
VLPTFAVFDEDIETWISYKSRFIDFLELNEYPDEKKNRGFLVHLSPIAYNKVRDEIFPAEPKTLDFEKLIETLDEIYSCL